MGQHYFYFWSNVYLKQNFSLFLKVLKINFVLFLFEYYVKFGKIIQGKRWNLIQKFINSPINIIIKTCVISLIRQRYSAFRARSSDFYFQINIKIVLSYFRKKLNHGES